MENKKYSKIVEFLAHLERFESEVPDGDLKSFCSWYLNQETPFYHQIKNEDSEIAQKIKELSAPSMNRLLGQTLFRMSRYADFYIRKQINSLGIKNIEEFRYLISFLVIESPNKTEVIQYNISEFTSGIEVIKRLIKNGWVIEHEDPEDRRSKRLELTQEGFQLAIQAVEKLKDVGKVMFIGMEEPTKYQIFELLRPLDDLHSRCFWQNRDADLSEALENLEKEQEKQHAESGSVSPR